MNDDGSEAKVTVSSSVDVGEKRPSGADEGMEQFVQTVANWLEETEESAMGQVRKIVRKAGSEQTMALLKEVLAIEEQGGMLIGDKSRRRTVGGVFFYLGRKKGYLPHVWSQQKRTGQAGEGKVASPFQWQDRLAEMVELQQEQGVTSVKITLIGRPGRVSNHGAFIVTTMQSGKVPSLPKGLPIPAQAKTSYSVYIVAKQWRKVEESLSNPEDILIVEGFPMLDKETGTIAVFVSSIATKFLQAADREQKKAAQGSA